MLLAQDRADPVANRATGVYLLGNVARLGREYFAHRAFLPPISRYVSCTQTIQVQHRTKSHCTI